MFGELEIVIVRSGHLTMLVCVCYDIYICDGFYDHKYNPQKWTFIYFETMLNSITDVPARARRSSASINPPSNKIQEI